jgi:hypothetical protein
MSILPRRLVTSLSLVLVAFSVSACKDDPTGTTGDALSAAETAQMVSAIFFVLQELEIPLLDGPSATSGPAATPYGDLYDDEVDVEINCDEVGAATMTGLITGDVDQEDGTADLDMDATMDFVNCMVFGEDVVLTLDGNPDVEISADIIITESLITLSIDTEGSVAFTTSDDREGTCGVNLTISASASEAGGVVETLSGSVCGVNASGLDISLFED